MRRKTQGWVPYASTEVPCCDESLICVYISCHFYISIVKIDSFDFIGINLACSLVDINLFSGKSILMYQYLGLEVYFFLFSKSVTDKWPKFNQNWPWKKNKQSNTYRRVNATILPSRLVYLSDYYPAT